MPDRRITQVVVESDVDAGSNLRATQVLLEADVDAGSNVRVTQVLLEVDVLETVAQGRSFVVIAG